jgi:hypothetical protein
MLAHKNNYISYSLWGDKPIYNTGIIRNIEQAKNIYPGWQVIVYHDNTVPEPIINSMKKAGALTTDMTGGVYGMFWRFLAADLPDCNHVIFRDGDSRLSIREKLAVDEWTSSGNAIHIMRDHPYHQDPVDGIRHYILGGMWGIKGQLFDMKALIDDYCSEKKLDYGSDQIFLNQVYYRFKNSATIHDEFFSDLSFPVKRDGYRFIGERIDEHEKPADNDWKAIKKFYASKKPQNIVLNQIKKAIRSILR